VTCSCGLNVLRSAGMFYVIVFFISLVRFQVPMMMTAMIMVFWDVTTCNFLVITTVSVESA